MAIYDGFVSLGDEEIHVILGVDDDRVTMSSNGSEIGEWPTEEVTIDHLGQGTYEITAENESLRFVPNDPDLFAIGFGPVEPPPIPVPAGNTPAKSLDEKNSRTGRDDGDAPPPKQMTRAAFYTLVTITTTLGLWALVSMLMG